MLSCIRVAVATVSLLSKQNTDYDTWDAEEGMDIAVVTNGAIPDCGTQKAHGTSGDFLAFSLSPSHSEGVLPDTGWPCVPRTGLSEGLITHHTHLMTWPHTLYQDRGDLLAAKARPPDQGVSSSVFLGAAPSLQLTLLPALGRQEEL